MSPRALVRLGLAGALVLVIPLPAAADFVYERSIPAPDLPEYTECVTGLDHADSSLVVVSSYVDGPEGGSFFFKIDPLDGSVRRTEAFPGVPWICPTNYWQLSAVAHVPGGGDSCWVVDQCGEICLFRLAGGGVIEDSFELPGALHPIGAATDAETLYVLDEDNQWVISRYLAGETAVIDTVALPGMSGPPAALTTWRNHLLVAAYPTGGLAGQTLDDHQFLLWEYNRDGVLLCTHTAESPIPCAHKNIAFAGERLYVKGDCPDSILVFRPQVYEREVPPGDSVVIEVIPSIVEVAFDSVSAGGLIGGEVVDQDPCPSADGVGFFSQVSHLTPSARFDYAAEVTVSTPEGLPPGVNPGRVRVLSRPSGGCQPYLDITTAPTELPATLISITRTKSEDDEFSVFALGEDWRPPRAAVEEKFGRLGAHIDAGEDSIPPDALARMRGLLAASMDQYYRGRPYLAADYADSIALTARDASEIPHTYDPAAAGWNLAGGLVSDAHTLAFSLRYAADTAVWTGSFFDPDHIDDSPDGFIRAYIYGPPGSEILEVDPEHIYVEHQARAIPESTSVEPCLAGGKLDGLRVRTVFHADELAGVLPPVGETTVMLTCLINGYKVFSDPTIFGPGAAVPGSGAEAPWGLTVQSNPSVSQVVLEARTGGAGPAEIRIYSVDGRLVRVLAVEEAREGIVTLTWRLDSREGRRVAPGTYFAVLREGSRVDVRKVVVER